MMIYQLIWVFITLMISFVILPQQHTNTHRCIYTYIRVLGEMNVINMRNEVVAEGILVWRAI